MTRELAALRCRLVGHVGARSSLSGRYECRRCRRTIVLPWAGYPHAAGVTGSGNAPGGNPPRPPTPAAVEHRGDVMIYRIRRWFRLQGTETWIHTGTTWRRVR